MSARIAPQAGRIGAALGFILVLGAAAPKEMQVEIAAPLAPQAADPVELAAAKIVTGQNASFQAAPVPDPDADAPVDTSKPSAAIGPKLLSTKSLFQGDGYYHSSSEQNTQDARRSPAPGLGLSLPVD